MESRRLTRRNFLKWQTGITLGALGWPTLVPRTIFGKTAPSNRITMGFIGVGGMGTNNMDGFLAKDEAQVVAVCDVETGSNTYGHWYNKKGWLGREPARERADNYYTRKHGMGTYRACESYIDFWEIIGRDDIDAVVVATPDHWHAIPVIEAARAGKDIY